jgi:SOS-response transcriptional repressor LexA
VAPNKNPDGSDNPLGRQKNRRVEIIVDTCGTAPQIKYDKNLAWVDDMDLGYLSQGAGEPHKGKSNGDKAITLAGKVYTRGIGTHSPSEMSIDLKGVGKKFESTIGIDDEVGASGSTSFEVWLDGAKVFDSGIMKGGDAPINVSLDLTGIRSMVLIASDGGNGIADDDADWADARISLVEGAATKPEAMSIENSAPIIIASSDAKSEPAVHGAKIVGASPNKPFLFLIPTTGSAPFKFSAANLPAGLRLDSTSGIISGAIENEGSTDVALTVENAAGTTQSTLTIICGKDKLGLTPPMGWNSWKMGFGDDNIRKARNPGIQLAGTIAAGRPIDAVGADEFLEIDSQYAGTDCYALKVKGDSMIEDGIYDGDYVIVKPNPSPRNGEIVVALLEDGCATLKRFFKESDRFRLQPANSEMQPIMVDAANDLQVQGTVVALFRKL